MPYNNESKQLIRSILVSGNHSCIPNAEATFPDNNFNLVMEAKTDISEGDVSDLILPSSSVNRPSPVPSFFRRYVSATWTNATEVEAGTAASRYCSMSHCRPNLPALFTDYLLISDVLHFVARENYLFTCECPTCVSQIDDPDHTSEDEDDEEEELMDGT